MVKNILVISDSPFFGGGEIFILKVLQKIPGTFFIVLCDELYHNLPNDRSVLFSSTNKFLQYKEIKGIVRKYSIDTLILNGGRTIIFAPFFPKCKVVIYRHTTNESVHPRLKRVLSIFILHFCYIYANKVVHVSNFSKREQKICKKKAEIVYNGVSYSPKVERVYYSPLKLLFLARLDKSKGIEEVINAVKKFSPDSVVLDVVGAGPMEPFVRTSVNDQIHFYGFQKDVAKFYKKNDVFIMLSHFENCSFSLIDALKYSMPIISTGVGGIPEIVKNNQNGYLVNNVEEAIQAIQKFLNKPNLIREMGNKSRELYEQNFDSEITINKIKDILSTL